MGRKADIENEKVKEVKRVKNEMIELEDSRRGPT